MPHYSLDEICAKRDQIFSNEYAFSEWVADVFYDAEMVLDVTCEISSPLNTIIRNIFERAVFVWNPTILENPNLITEQYLHALEQAHKSGNLTYGLYIIAKYYINNIDAEALRTILLNRLFEDSEESEDEETPEEEIWWMTDDDATDIYSEHSLEETYGDGNWTARPCTSLSGIAPPFYYPL